MTPPRRLRIGPLTYTVSDDRTKVLEASRDSGKFLYAETDVEHLRIIIDGGMPPDHRRLGLIHEVLHALTDVTGIASDFKDDEEERLVTRLAPALLDALRRNTTLVTYLMEDA